MSCGMMLEMMEEQGIFGTSAAQKEVSHSTSGATLWRQGCDGWKVAQVEGSQMVYGARTAAKAKP